MRRDTENALLVLVGVSVAMIAVTGAYTRYVKPGLLPWLAATAALLIGLGLAAIIRDVRQGDSGHEHEDHEHGEPEHAGHECGDHEHRRGMTWLLVMPVIVLIFIAPPPLSARAVSPAALGASASTPRRAFPPLPPGHAPTVSLPEVLMRIATDSSDTLAGRQITVTGFTMKDGDHTDLAKIVIVCCAADAQLARLRVGGPALALAASLPENTWVSAEGTVPSGQNYRGPSSVPVIDVASVTQIDPPKNTY